MRLIDADELKEILKDPPLYASLGGMTLNDVFMLIDNEAPSIELVRCGECKYWMDDRKDEDDMGTCGLTHYFTNTDDFCSYGEREGE